MGVWGLRPSGSRTEGPKVPTGRLRPFGWHRRGAPRQDAARFGYALALAQGVEKKLITVVDATLAAFFRPLAGLGDGDAFALLMVAPAALTPMGELVRDHGGRIVYEADATAAETDPEQTPLYELTGNHSTLQVLKKDRGVTYTQTLPVIRYTTPERLDEIMAIHEEEGVFIANPHVMTVEDGSRHKRVSGDQLGFKQRVDPKGLSTPGRCGATWCPADRSPPGTDRIGFSVSPAGPSDPHRPGCDRR
jgi:hypothetical protein